MNIKLISDRVCIKPTDTGEVKIGSIIIPDAAKSSREFARRGIIVAVGQHTECPGCGYYAWPIEVSVGDRVLFSNRYTGRDYKAEDGEIYLIMRQVDIIAVEL